MDTKTTTPTERRLAITPKRYTAGHYDYGHGASGPTMEEDEDGEWVNFDDYAKLCSERDELVGEMRRHLWVLQRAQADPILWEKLTVATGVATLNGYEAVLAKHKPE